MRLHDIQLLHCNFYVHVYGTAAATIAAAVVFVFTLA
jgi:hypothetical protein